MTVAGMGYANRNRASQTGANRTTQAEIFQPPAAEFSGTGHCLLLRISGLLSPRLMIIGGAADPCNLRAFDVSYRKHEISEDFGSPNKVVRPLGCAARSRDGV